MRVTIQAVGPKGRRCPEKTFCRNSEDIAEWSVFWKTLDDRFGLNTQPADRADPRLDERMIIQLTEEQVQAVAASGSIPPTLVDPHTQTNYVLIRKDVYERMTTEGYDDSPWTAEERDALAWEAGKHAGWDDMSEYDDVMEKP